MPGAVLDYDWRDIVRVALTASYLWQPDRIQIGDVRLGDTVNLALGVGVNLPIPGLSVSTAGHVAIGLDTTSAELIAAVRWRDPSGVFLTLGAGAGLVDTAGAPDMRAMVGLGWGTLEEEAPEEDVPDLGDLLDETIQIGPPSEPPTDGPPATGTPEPEPEPEPPSGDVARDRAFDAAVAQDPDPDGDGVPGPADHCPTEAEDVDGFEDADGCPDPDNDRDGVADLVDRCPTEPETINGVDDADGCPDEGSASVRVGQGAVEIDQQVFFGPGSDTLAGRSEKLLSQVAQVLVANPWVRLVRVEGYTDNLGHGDKNVDLSERRARRVMAFLVAQGVAPERLTAKGYGPLDPVASNASAAGRAANRRVVFTLVEVGR